MPLSKRKNKERTPRVQPKSGRIIQFDNGSYIHINKLVEWRSLLTYLTENLKYQDNTRVGWRGPTVKECKKLLEVTA
ncbi:hypothetical protein LCGC14_0396600 [marine sediment metagenome]|uniref:Uncharacterized protein n=1 Tax=marine sediment metagenome TaxID=412755 RepID=A0A0F9W760_9ZZZZ